jgi:hypothetical protein
MSALPAIDHSDRSLCGFGEFYPDRWRSLTDFPSPNGSTSFPFRARQWTRNSTLVIDGDRESDVDIEHPGKLADPARTWSLPHGAAQDDDGTKIDFSAETTHRWWCHTLSASVAISAETESTAILVA